jgi:phytoene synthase
LGEDVGAGWAVTVREAYAACRVIARREAKNFYYAFRVLPRAKSDAMCAVYAFMRRADDLADDESLTLEQRRVGMTAWLEDWRAARAGGAMSDAVFLALGDAQRRFGISDELLEDLVRGTSLDLEERPEGVVALSLATIHTPGMAAAGIAAKRETYQVYETFEGLYGYCYLVASVVGLVCIRVFGYTDEAAEKLAEQTGVAFQLTNILRDVKEDVERGRIYLPMDDMRATGTGVEQVVLAVKGVIDGSGVKELMRREGDRARGYYGSAEALLPLIDRDSRAALWVMVTIYRELLERIAEGGYSVTERASVSTGRKVWILARGMAMAAGLRVTG